MTRDEFWDVIEAAQGASLFVRASLPAALREQLEERTAEDLVDFARHFSDCRLDAFGWEVWAVAWIAGGGASDEDFSDFRNWLLTLGREAFDATLHHSEAILDFADPADLRDPFDAEIARVAPDLYREWTGSEIPAPRPDPPAPAGRKWRPEDLPRRFPRLWQRFIAQ